MTTANRRKGSSWELDILKYARSLGFPAERLHLAGSKDEGDVAINDAGVVYVVEAKNTAHTDLSGFVRQAEVEAANYAAARNLDPDLVWGIVVLKRRNRPVRDAYVITTLSALLE